MRYRWSTSVAFVSVLILCSVFQALMTNDGSIAWPAWRMFCIACCSILPFSASAVTVLVRGAGTWKDIMIRYRYFLWHMCIVLICVCANVTLLCNLLCVPVVAVGCVGAAFVFVAMFLFDVGSDVVDVSLLCGVFVCVASVACWFSV